jgi:hypothetical protein
MLSPIYLNGLSAECSNLLASIINDKIGFESGIWLFVSPGYMQRVAKAQYSHKQLMKKVAQIE